MGSDEVTTVWQPPLHLGQVAPGFEPAFAVRGAFFGQEHVHEAVGVVGGVDGELNETPGFGGHGGFAELDGVHLSQALEALDADLSVFFVGGEAIKDSLALCVVESVEGVFADVDAVERRHGDEEVSGFDQGPEVTQEQGAQERGDMGAVGIGVGKDADLAVPEAGDVGRTRRDPDGDGDVVDFLRGQYLP